MSSEFWYDFRRFFLRGLAAVLPTVLTVIIIIYVFNFVQDRIGERINQGVIYVLAHVRDAPPLPADVVEPPKTNVDAWRLWWEDRSYLRGVGFVVAIIGIYFIGRFAASLFGRFIWRLIDRALLRMPLIKLVYPNVKQVTDFLLSDRKMEFSRVVAVEYPRKGIWSLGLVTGPGLSALQKVLDPNLLTVFVPSSPTPITGYTITVRRDEVIDVPLTIDEALRFIVSAGVVAPGAKAMGRKPLPQEPASAVAAARGGGSERNSGD